MILGILIGATAALVFCYIVFLLVSFNNSKRGERTHNELMKWHERSLTELQERNGLGRDMVGLLEAIRDNIRLLP